MHSKNRLYCTLDRKNSITGFNEICQDLGVNIMKKIVMTAFQSLFGERIDFQSYNYYYYVHRKLIKQILSEVWLLIPHTIKVSRLYQTK